jgi:deoxyribodipyrimidine photo-lyase
MRLFWHQRDLRVRDNHGLCAAGEDGEVLPVYVVDERVAGHERRDAFRADCVAALRAAYRERGSELVVREGAPAEVLPALAAEYGADAVYWTDHYRPARRRRDARVERACERAGLSTESRTDLVLVDPAALAPRYESHRQFREDWDAVPKPDPYPAPGDGALADVRDDGAVPERTTDVDLPAAGYDAARARLDDFLDRGVETYADTRDDLARAVAAPATAVSRMSPHLAAGTIGIREVWAATTRARERATGDAPRNVEKYRDELSWREGNYALLYHHPDLLTENYRSFEEPIAWRADDDAFEAWAAGETGYPLVDAGMRQLEREGYVHNRPRQVVASFLTKHLLVDWRRGEAHFADRLVDYDPANNAGNWQWTASTGTDTVDVRIFDPVSQMAKYDPDAEFVTEYVPELRGVPAARIVEWPTLTDETRANLAPEYPHPIVDRDRAYRRAQRVFKRALGKR